MAEVEGGHHGVEVAEGFVEGGEGGGEEEGEEEGEVVEEERHDGGKLLGTGKHERWRWRRSALIYQEVSGSYIMSCHPTVCEVSQGDCRNTSLVGLLYLLTIEFDVVCIPIA